MDIKIVKRPVRTWKAFDFVVYFYNKCQQIYQTLDQSMFNVESDCYKVKRMIDTFQSHNRSKVVFKQFMDWAIDDYVYGKKKYVLPITIGFLSCRIEDYLQVKIEKKKKIRSKAQLSKVATDWLAEQKKIYTVKLTDAG